jgi:hypothetical protein
MAAGTARCGVPRRASSAKPPSGWGSCWPRRSSAHHQPRRLGRLPCRAPAPAGSWRRPASPRAAMMRLLNAPSAFAAPRALRARRRRHRRQGRCRLCLRVGGGRCWCWWRGACSGCNACGECWPCRNKVDAAPAECCPGGIALGVELLQTARPPTKFDHRSFFDEHAASITQSIPARDGGVRVPSSAALAPRMRGGTEALR